MYISITRDLIYLLYYISRQTWEIEQKSDRKLLGGGGEGEGITNNYPKCSIFWTEIDIFQIFVTTYLGTLLYTPLKSKSFIQKFNQD